MKTAKLPEDRLKAANQIGKYGEAAKEAIPAIMAMISQKQSARKKYSPFAFPLAMIGTSAFPAMKEAAKDKDPYVRTSAVVAIAALDKKVKLGYDLLFEAIEDADRNVGYYAFEGIQMLGLKGNDIPLKTLIVMLESNQSVDYAARSIGVGKRSDADALPTLLKLIAPRDAKNIRNPNNAAIQAIGRLGPAAAPAEKPLTELLTNRDFKTRLDAACSLIKINDKNEKAYNAIKKEIATVRYDELAIVLKYVESMGAKSKPLIPSLQAAKPNWTAGQLSRIDDVIKIIEAEK